MKVNLIVLAICFLYVGCAHKNQEVKLQDSKRGFYHNVYFWLKSDITEAQKTDFMEGLNSMKAIETIIDYEVGIPAGTPRDVVDNSYDVALITSFADSEGHDAYQVHPIHDAFREIAGPMIDSLRIYDSVME